ncbi:hypothetical protein SDC9_209380 [bioreactor metagenome]|uniref:Uncharacterized protein n=1 Tax=bioreactor metagenome TaxID=1076179 RepID=A0A645JEN6_9ZZZZ
MYRVHIGRHVHQLGKSSLHLICSFLREGYGKDVNRTPEHIRNERNPVCQNSRLSASGTSNNSYNPFSSKRSFHLI